MLETLSFLVTIELWGLAGLPLVWWLFRALPDRGVAFAKAAALLIVGYAIWLGGSVGVLLNTRATAILAVGVLATVAWLNWGRAFVAWGKQNRVALLRAELVFLAFFLSLAVFRAFNPEILGTEKPMDFAFLNASLRAERLPPEDPWLAGYGISYYYFGYFLMSLVIKVAGVPAAVGYNLSLALVGGLAAAGAYGVVYNLVAAREKGARGDLFYPLLGPVFLLLLANLEGVFEVLHNNNLLPLSFWRWLGIRDLMSPRQGPYFFPTDPPDTWWWWRASRVVGQVDPDTGASLDYTINEFPFFSFLLGDLHPHVMALPFFLLVVGVALVVYREGQALLSAAGSREGAARLVLFGVMAGALGFLNTWDLPTGALIVVGAFALGELGRGGRFDGRLIGRVLALSGGLVILSSLAYAPFYVGLRSQASGLGLVSVRTSPQQLLVFWGPLLIVAGTLPAAVWLNGTGKARGRTLLGFALGGGAVVVLGSIIDATSFALMVVLLVGIAAVLWSGLREVRAADRDGATAEGLGGAAFVLLLAGVAFALIAGCEVVFIRDTFGTRMNTVFKFYYQAWVLLAVVGAYTLYYVDLRGRWLDWPAGALSFLRVWRVAATLIILGGFVYTVFAPISKANGFAGSPTLDGLAWVRAGNPHQMEAIAWLQSQPGTPVLLEASGGEYSQENQASAFTGLPTVLGWMGHEYQWRGQTPVPAQRKADIDIIYQTVDPNLAESLLRQYGVRYVYVGDSERRIYASAPPGALSKFERFMDVAYRNERVTIYELRPLQPL